MGADQLRSYCEADLSLCFPIGKNPGFLLTWLVCYNCLLLFYFLFSARTYAEDMAQRIPSSKYQCKRIYDGIIKPLLAVSMQLPTSAQRTMQNILLVFWLPLAQSWSCRI